ncbi:carbon-nitrogen hydrolase family protein [Mucilaginibacter sp. SMC90]|uniref:carbon-nitrogen hydrolase family protein n=1 Tax=Mucilaginibacter sp. SMC90 TaxID=2929803 RepID=UPI001FB326D9|nr:carbon-nitrogen hydrolase family protein [Mucilaginibacter sp. SMC90]UOE47090.1 carbon-nitrogen hydrolase family protein [Mucilaginibacter sp. SMC90]
MKIAIATPPFPKSINDGLLQARKFIKDAAAQQAAIICFPESYIPGYPGMVTAPEPISNVTLQSALDEVSKMAAENNIAVIMPMDWYGEDGLLNLAHVISNTGEVLGYQTKNQLDPSEDAMWVAGTQRSIFEVNGLKFGISICHEGFRYPESVRWAARNGAHIVFHPHFSGSNTDGVLLTEWGSMANPYYEKAMMMRALENTIYFASSNYGSLYPESASSVIAPDGTCLAYQAYGTTGIIIADIDLEKATGYLAKRFKPQLYDY